MTARTRMSPDDRRRQLLDLGAELFASTAYDDVHIEAVAELAGVSRGLLYHYFPTKRQFFVELLQAASAQLAQATAPEPTLGPVEQLRHGVEAYLDHCSRHRAAAQSIHRGAASGDVEVQAIIRRSTEAHAEHIVQALAPSGPPAPVLRIAVISWLDFLRTACQEWLTDRTAAKEEVRDMCVASLVGAVLSLPAHARPALNLD